MNNLNLLDLNMSVAAGTDSGEDRYVIFNLAEAIFAVNCKYVVSIEKPTAITEMANASMGVRGVGYYKDEAINIFDLRIIFGYPSHEYHVENEINIGRHIMEHESWAMGIRESVMSGNAFGSDFTADPSGCDLGKWFENYRTTNINVQNIIKRIEPVHEKFHKYADSALDFRSNNQDEIDSFLAEAEAVKNELMQNLNELRDVLLNQAKELTVVLRINDKRIGIIIDDAESVEALDDIQSLPPAVLATEYIKRLGFRKKDRLLADREKPIMLILEAEMFV